MCASVGLGVKITKRVIRELNHRQSERVHAMHRTELTEQRIVEASSTTISDKNTRTTRHLCKRDGSNSTPYVEQTSQWHNMAKEGRRKQCLHTKYKMRHTPLFVQVSERDGGPVVFGF